MAEGYIKVYEVIDQEFVANAYGRLHKGELEVIIGAKEIGATVVIIVIKRFLKLAENGGYVWAQYYNTDNILIGKVPPKSEIEFLELTWKNQKYKNKLGEGCILKALQLEDTKIVKANELLSMKAARPRQGTFSRWRAVKNNLKIIIENEKRELKWDNLSPDQQETICAEFLRVSRVTPIPTIEYLLLPVGRTLKDIDIYGVANDEKKVFSQVTYKDKQESDYKIKRLREYNDENTYLIMFCKCKVIHTENNVIYIPIKEVEAWLLENKDYAKCFI